MPIMGGGGGGGAAFNGGTITEALAIAPTDPNATALIVQDAAGTEGNGQAEIRHLDEHGNVLLSQDCDGNTRIALGPQGSNIQLLNGLGDVAIGVTWTGAISLNREVGQPVNLAYLRMNDDAMGFFGAAPSAQPVLASLTATPTDIVLALQGLGLAGGT